MDCEKYINQLCVCEYTVESGIVPVFCRSFASLAVHSILQLSSLFEKIDDSCKIDQAPS